MGHLVTFSLDMVDSDVVLLPPIESMKDVTIHIAVRVGLQAQKDGVVQEMSEQELYEQVQKDFEFQNIKATNLSERICQVSNDIRYRLYHMIKKRHTKNIYQSFAYSKQEMVD